MTRNSPSKADRSPPSAYGRTDGGSSSSRHRQKGGSSRRSSSSRSRSRSPSRSRDHRGGSSSSRSSHSRQSSHRRHGRSHSRERSRRERSRSGSRSHRRSRSRSGSRGNRRESRKRSSPTEKMTSARVADAPPSATSLASRTAAASGATAAPQAPAANVSMTAPSVPLGVTPHGVSAALAAARAAAVRSGLMPVEALNAPPPQLPSSLPSYYNPTAVNPLKYSEQMQKRKLLWKKPQEEAPVDTAEPPNKPSSTCAKVWEGMTFAQDDDGKVTAKFRKLMGIRGDPPPPAEKPDPAASSLLKQQEKLFHDLDQQYEAARVSTHTHRGVGLGYSSQMATFFQQANLNTSSK